LAAIRSHAQTVRNGKSTDPRVAKSAIEHILASVDTLDRWLREIGTTIRPLEVQLAKQAVEPIIHDSLSLLRPQLDGKEIEVDYHAADFLPDVKVDRALFEQALLAVLCNAIDASPEGGTIKITLAGADNGHLDLHIEDQGEGIPAEVSQRVFDAFFTTKPHASGLGLTCAKRILDLHGGQIRIESTAHSGTRVRILLPAVGAAVNQPKS
jgi:signal transduction histidine kinase